jgi:FAD/FMN-containing dehydrogenase
MNHGLISLFFSFFTLLSLTDLETTAFGSTALSSPISSIQTQAEYLDALNAVNQELDHSNRILGCPGVHLALSCGNGVCESNQGENITTCPSDCLNTPVQSYNDQTFCQDVKEIFKPKNEKEVQEVILQAALEKQHVRVIGTTHTTNTSFCTDGTIISTENLNRILGIENFEGQETVVVEPGVVERDLTEWLDKNGKALGYGLVGYRGISIGGMIANAAHGSSAKHSAILSSQVASIRLVTATGQILELSGNNSDLELFKAAKANLGRLGVVVQMRLKVRPQFNLDTRITFESEDKIVNGRNAVDLIRKCDFGQILWYPNSKKIMKMCGYETSLPAQHNANNILLDPYIPNGLVKPYLASLHFGACSKNLNSLIEKLRYVVNLVQPPLRMESQTGKPVYSTRLIGASHLMLSSELGEKKNNTFIRDWEAVIPESEVPNAMKEIKSYIHKNRLSFPLVGIFLRFSQIESSTWLATNSESKYFTPGKVAAHIEFPTYFPIGFSPANQKNFNQHYETLMKMLISKHHGRIHWGKNNESLFAFQKSTGESEENIAQFQKAIMKLDPEGMFENSFSKSFLDLSTTPH